MDANKSQDILGSILRETLSTRADELQKEGKSITDISKILNDDRISSIVEKLLERASSDNVSFYKLHLHEIIEDDDIEKNRFLQHHRSIWGKCFEASRVMYIIAVEGAESFCQYVTNNIPVDTYKSKHFTFLLFNIFMAVSANSSPKCFVLWKTVLQMEPMLVGVQCLNCAVRLLLSLNRVSRLLDNISRLLILTIKSTNGQRVQKINLEKKS